jgi:hypothetical protein
MFAARLKGVRNIAVLLIVIGLGVLIWGAFGFVTKKKVLDVGPVNVTKNEEHRVPYGPLAGGVLVVGGIVILMGGKR